MNFSSPSKVESMNPIEQASDDIKARYNAWASRRLFVVPDRVEILLDLMKTPAFKAWASAPLVIPEPRR